MLGLLWVLGLPFSAQASLTTDIQQQIQSRKSSDFKVLLKRLESNYGSRAVDPLLRLANDTRLSDPDRYIALMGSAKIGGKGIAPRILPFLKDSSWMIRNGALRALSVLKDPRTGPGVLKLLQDPALVVRLEAVAAVESLRPSDAAPALVRAIHDKANYHGDKAQWVPLRALQALEKIGNRAIAQKLTLLLDRHQDPALLQQTIKTLEKLTGKKVESGRPLRVKAAGWKRELARM